MRAIPSISLIGMLTTYVKGGEEGGSYVRGCGMRGHIRRVGWTEKVTIMSLNSTQEWKDAALALDEHMLFDDWKLLDEDPYYDWKLVRKVRDYKRRHRRPIHPICTSHRSDVRSRLLERRMMHAAS